MKWCNEENTKIHFVGIGGIGMSGIAEVLFNQGYKISGSDLSDSAPTRRLEALGIEIFKGHHARNVENAQVVVVSSAVSSSNLEVLQARNLMIPVIPRAEMLAEIMRGKTGIAIAGTHGKTTTTSMMAAVLTVAGLDPTSIVGGIVGTLGSNAKLGQGDFVIAEADESDGSFLRLPTTFSVITNINSDHLDFYKNLDAIDTAFTQFVAQHPFYGMVAVCGDDPGIQRNCKKFFKPFVSYGFGKDCRVRARKIKTPGISNFEVYSDDKLLGQIMIQVPGDHNILNALGVITICLRLGISFEVIQRGLASYRGVQRRFEIKWQSTNGKQMIVDDYGHHPTEIKATLKAAREYWPGRIITCFQPHRYSRTQNCYELFLCAFEDSDRTIILDIYAAGEAAIEGIDSKTLATDIQLKAKSHTEYSSNFSKTLEQLKSELIDGDLILFLGAGSITKYASQLAFEMAPKLNKN